MSIEVQNTQTVGDAGNTTARNESKKKSHSTARDLLKVAGGWKGDDLEKCLEEVYRTRGETLF